MSDQVKFWKDSRDTVFGKVCDANMDHWKKTVMGILDYYPNKEDATVVLIASIRAIKFTSMQQGSDWTVRNLNLSTQQESRKED